MDPILSNPNAEILNMTDDELSRYITDAINRAHSAGNPTIKFRILEAALLAIRNRLDNRDRFKAHH